MPVAHQLKVKDAEISSLVLPTKSRALLLPNVAVAEIVTDQELEQLPETGWFLGLGNWRSMQIPIVAFERLVGKQIKLKSKKVSLAVLNGFLGEPSLPFYGVIISGLPSLERIVAGELVVESANVSPIEQYHVIVSGEDATIPNLANLEKQILEKRSKM